MPAAASMPETIQKLRHVANSIGQLSGLLMPRRSGKHQRVFVHTRAAAGCVGDDGVHVVGQSLKRLQIRPGDFRAASPPEMPRQSSATGLTLRDHHFDAVSCQYLDRGVTDFRGEHLSNRSLRASPHGQQRPLTGEYGGSGCGAGQPITGNSSSIVRIDFRHQPFCWQRHAADSDAPTESAR